MAEKMTGRILAISYAFPPWLAPRSIQVQRILNGLSYNKYEITIIRKSLFNINVPIDHKLAALLSPKVRTIEVKERQNGSYRVIKKILNRFPAIPDAANSWAFDAYCETKNIIRDIDLVMTFSTPVSDHIVGLLIKRIRSEVPWIVCFSDPFIENPYIHWNHFEKIVNRILEKGIIKKANAVIFVNEFLRQKTMNKFPIEWFRKTHVIPHAFNEKLYPESYNSCRKLLIRYLGDFYGGRTPETLFRALGLLSKTIPDISSRLRIEIYGSRSEHLEKWVAEHGVKDIVTLKGLVDYNESLVLMRESDVLLVIDAPAEENLFLTSKLIDYLGARRPILAITPLRGPTAELMNEIGCIPYDFYDVPRIASQIVEYLEKKEKGRLSIEIPEHVYDRYRVGVIVKKYMDVIKSFHNYG